MAPLLLAGFGVAFVVVVVRVFGIDIVPDTVGLAMYAAGLWRLSRGSRLVVVAAALAGIAAVLALLNFTPHLLPEPAGTDVAFGYNVVVALAVGIGAEGVGQRARAVADAVAHQFRAVAGVTAVGLALLIAGFVVVGSDRSLALSVLSLAQLLAVVALIWYAVLLLLCAGRVWAQPDGVSTDAAPPEATAPIKRADS